MRLWIVLVIATVAASLTLWGCMEMTNASAAEQASVEISCDDFIKSHHISLSRTIEISVGDSLNVTLCSNPTTGFQWSELAQISDQTLLQQIDHQFVPPQEQDVEGAAGKEIWTFNALKKGTSNISMEYSRPWEGGEKGEWTFTLYVVVK